MARKCHYHRLQVNLGQKGSQCNNNFVNDLKKERCSVFDNALHLCKLTIRLIYLFQIHLEENKRVTPPLMKMLTKNDTWNLELHLVDNRIQNFHLGRYIVGYTV